MKNIAYKYKAHHINLAFTLAEVLIVIGIIGIIAEMTIPTLYNNVQKRVAATKVEQAYSQILQAIKLSEVDNGDFKTWDLNQTESPFENTKLCFNQYFKPYFKGLTFCSIGLDLKCGVPVSGDGYNYLLSNGTGFSILINGSIIYIVIDINGPNKPNEMGKDTWYFDTQNYLRQIMPSGWVKDLTREQALQGYLTNDGNYYSCEKGNGAGLTRHGCTALLMLDGWQIKDDYPW